MAKIKNGIFSNPSGRVANVIFSSRNGVPYIKAAPAKVKNPNTPKQQAARMKLSVTAQLLRELKPLIQIGFMHTPLGKTSRDLAFTANYETAVKGEFPDLSPNYENAIVSGGPLPKPEQPIAEFSDNQLTINWQKHPSGSYSSADSTMVFIYDSRSKMCWHDLHKASASSLQLKLTPSEHILEALNSHPDEVYIWLAFANLGNKQHSDSVVCGRG